MKYLAKDSKRGFTSPKPDAVRALVFDVLTEVNHRGGYSNLLLPSALNGSNFDSRDKGFATELLYGTIRMQGRHDFILSQVFDRPIENIDPGIIDICRLGVHQLFQMRVATHAAVSATVELARKVIGESKASYVNAILRKVSSQAESIWLEPASVIEDQIAKLSIIHSHPEWIVSAYFDLLKDYSRVEAELIANNIPARPTLVSWPGLSSQEDLVSLGGVPTLYSPYGAVTELPPSEIELVRQRLAGVQDEGSQLVAHIFMKAAAEAKQILDLCAGPGGKAALLSAIAHRDGQRFVANEVSEARAELVKRVVRNSAVWCTDGRMIASQEMKFDAVLADVPCTGLGALRRRPEVRWRRTVQDLRGLIELQMELVSGAISVLEPQGIFGYATCSPHYAETSAQVKTILKRYPELEQLDVAQFIPENLQGATRDGALSLWTSAHQTDSMFLALFRKRENTVEP